MRTELYIFYLQGGEQFIHLSQNMSQRPAGVVQPCFNQETNTIQKGTEYNEPWPTVHSKQELNAASLDQGKTLTLLYMGR